MKEWGYEPNTVCEHFLSLCIGIKASGTSHWLCRMPGKGPKVPLGLEEQGSLHTTLANQPGRMGIWSIRHNYTYDN